MIVWSIARQSGLWLFCWQTDVILDRPLPPFLRLHRIDAIAVPKRLTGARIADDATGEPHNSHRQASIFIRSIPDGAPILSVAELLRRFGGLSLQFDVVVRIDTAGGFPLLLIARSTEKVPWIIHRKSHCYVRASFIVAGGLIKVEIDAHDLLVLTEKTNG